MKPLNRKRPAKSAVGDAEDAPVSPSTGVLPVLDPVTPGVTTGTPLYLDDSDGNDGDDGSIRRGPSVRRQGELNRLLGSLTAADHTYIQSALSTGTVAPVATAEGQYSKAYRLLNKTQKRTLNEAVVSCAKLLGKSQYAELLNDSAAFAGSDTVIPGQAWKKAKAIPGVPKPGQGILYGAGEGEEGVAAVAAAADYAEPDSPDVDIDQLDPVGTDGGSYVESDDLLTGLLKTMAGAYRALGTPQEKKQLLSLVAPLLNSLQGIKLFGVSHHTWEAARAHAKEHGAYALPAQKTVHRVRVDAALEQLIDQFWRQDKYITVAADGRVELRQSLALKSVWSDFCSEYPQHISEGSATYGDKTKIGRTAFLNRVPAELRRPKGFIPATGEFSDLLESRGIPVKRQRTPSKRPAADDGLDYDEGVDGLGGEGVLQDAGYSV